MLLALLHERKRPFLRRHFCDLAGQRIGAAFVCRTLVGVRRAADIAVDGRFEQRRVADAFDRRLHLRSGECVHPVAGGILRENVLYRCRVRLRVPFSIETVGIVLQTAEDVLEELLAPPGIDRIHDEVARERPVVHIHGAQVGEHGTGPVGVAIQNGLRRLVIYGLQRIRIAAADVMPERHDANQFQDAIEVIRGKLFPGSKEHRGHLSGAEQDQVANAWPGRWPVLPKFVVRIGKGSVQLRSFLERFEQVEDLLCSGDAVANQLEQSLLANPRLLAEKVIAEEFGEAFRSHNGDQGMPAPLQRVQIGLHPDLGEEVVLQQVGNGQLQPTCIQSLEHGVCIQLVLHRDENEEQVSGYRFRQDSGKGFAVLLYVAQRVELLREVPKALPEKRVGSCQAAWIRWASELDQIVLVEGVVGPAQIQPAAFDEGCGVLLSDEAIPKLRGAFPVVLSVDVSIGDPMQLGDDGQ